MIVDLTTLDKCGKFKNFQHLIHVFNGKRGLHLVVLYLVVGYCRVPWGFRVWRGKDTPSPAQLALRLIDTLPKKLTQAFRVIVLADTAFGSVDFLKGVRQRRYPAIVGVRCEQLGWCSYAIANYRTVARCATCASEDNRCAWMGYPFP